MNKKILIIGIDGLEYTLVKEMNLRNLLQKKYGKLDIPPECLIQTDVGAVPYTPKVWEALLTGEKPHKTDSRALWKYRNPILEKLRWLPLIKNVRGKRMFLRRIGFKPERTLFKIRRKTFLDLCTPSIYINVPGKNLDDKINTKINELIDEGKISTLWIVLDKYTNEIFEKFTIEIMNKEYKVAMMYINTLDLIGHLCWYKCFDKIVKLYKKVDRKVGRLLNSVEYDVSLIISDHGMRGSPDKVSGMHSNHLFYSLNIDYHFTNLYDIPNKIIE